MSRSRALQGAFLMGLFAAGCVAAPADDRPVPSPRLASTAAAVVGDGTLDPLELCDDGNTASGDGCDANGILEWGFACPTAGAACQPICGDGLQVTGETCDDGNTADGDGCSSTCALEPHATCTVGAIAADGTRAVGFSLNGAASAGGLVADWLARSAFNSTNGPVAFTATCPAGMYARVVPSGVACTPLPGGAAAPELLSIPFVPTSSANGNLAVACAHKQGGGATQADLTDKFDCFKTDDPAAFTFAGSFAAPKVSMGPRGGCVSGGIATKVYGSQSSTGTMVNMGLGCTRFAPVRAAPSVCSVCGNGLLETGETCDDGNTADGDGCSSACATEDGATCAAPATATCGGAGTVVSGIAFGSPAVTVGGSASLYACPAGQVAIGLDASVANDCGGDCSTGTQTWSVRGFELVCARVMATGDTLTLAEASVKPPPSSTYIDSVYASRCPAGSVLTGLSKSFIYGSSGTKPLAICSPLTSSGGVLSVGAPVGTGTVCPAGHVVEKVGNVPAAVLAVQCRPVALDCKTPSACSGGGGAGGGAGAGGSAGTGGSAGEAGSAGAGGSAGEAGSAGAGGSAGEAGSAGAGGSAGEAGSAGAGGSAGEAGSAGAGGSAGEAGSAGAGGNAGEAGSAGAGGSAGSAGSGTSGSAGSAGSGNAGSGGSAGSGNAGSAGNAGSGNAGSAGSAGSGNAGSGGTAGSGNAGSAGSAGSGNGGAGGSAGSGNAGAGGSAGSGNAGAGGGAGSGNAGAGTAGKAGAAGAKAGAAGGGGATGGGAGAAAGPGQDAVAEEEESGGCSTSARQARGGAPWLLGLIGAAFARRRRRAARA